MSEPKDQNEAACGGSALAAVLDAGRIERRFSWLIDQLDARFPSAVNKLSSRPPELAVLEAIDEYMARASN